MLTYIFKICITYDFVCNYICSADTVRVFPIISFKLPLLSTAGWWSFTQPFKINCVWAGREGDWEEAHTPFHTRHSGWPQTSTAAPEYIGSIFVMKMFGAENFRSFNGLLTAKLQFLCILYLMFIFLYISKCTSSTSAQYINLLLWYKLQ